MKVQELLTTLNGLSDEQKQQEVFTFVSHVGHDLYRVLGVDDCLTDCVHINAEHVDSENCNKLPKKRRK